MGKWEHWRQSEIGYSQLADDLALVMKSLSQPGGLTVLEGLNLDWLLSWWICSWQYRQNLKKREFFIYHTLFTYKLLIQNFFVTNSVLVTNLYRIFCYN